MDRLGGGQSARAKWCARAGDVLGGGDAARSWLRKPLLHLGNRIPETLAGDLRAERVSQLLKRAYKGVAQLLERTYKGVDS